MKEYKNPRLKHVKKIGKIIDDMRKDYISNVFDVDVYIVKKTDLILTQCNLLLETKKDSVKEDVKFLKDNGFKSLSKALVKLDKETKKAKKRKKETYYYRITGIHDDGSLSKTPKTGSFTVTQPDPKEESKKYLWSVADEERLDKKNAPDPKEEMREIEPLSKVVKKDQTDRKFVMCVAEKVEELVERVNILSKSK